MIYGPKHLQRFLNSEQIGSKSRCAGWGPPGDAPGPNDQNMYIIAFDQFWPETSPAILGMMPTAARDAPGPRAPNHYICSVVYFLARNISSDPPPATRPRPPFRTPLGPLLDPSEPLLAPLGPFGGRSHRTSQRGVVMGELPPGWSPRGVPVATWGRPGWPSGLPRGLRRGLPGPTAGFAEVSKESSTSPAARGSPSAGDAEAQMLKNTVFTGFYDL